jgi:hypothetical protein
VIIHGDPELTAIVARAQVARRFVHHEPWYDPFADDLRRRVVGGDRRGVIASITSYANTIATDVAGLDPAEWWGKECPAIGALRRYFLNGTDHTDLCLNGLTEFSMHLQSTEVA